jgi:GDP-D-mannose dehydratase
MVKQALLNGIIGQNSAYFAKFLIRKGYVVHGLQ